MLSLFPSYGHNAFIPVLFVYLITRQIEPVSGFAASRTKKSIRSGNDDPRGFGVKKTTTDGPSKHFRTRKASGAARQKNQANKISGGSSHTPDTTETMLKLMDFLRAEECEGVEVLEIGFDQHTGLRGVFCKEDIRAGEFICAIPFVSTLLVNEVYDPIKTASTSTTTAATTSPFDDDLLSASRLENGLFFLQRFWKDEQQHQRWKPYFDCIPRDKNDPNFDPTPDFWSSEEICQLQIPSLVDPLLTRKRSLEDLARDHTVSLAELQHAAWLIQTRAFTTFKRVLHPASDDNSNNGSSNSERMLRSRTVLIPFLDFINHSPTDDDKINTELQVVEAKEYDESFYALYATKNIPTGSEIRICYGTGQETFLDLFAKYGFLLAPSRKERQRLRKNGLDTCFTTSLEEDKQEIAGTSRGSTRARILEARIHVKRLLLENEAMGGNE